MGAINVECCLAMYKINYGKNECDLVTHLHCMLSKSIGISLEFPLKHQSNLKWVQINADDLKPLQITPPPIPCV